MATSQLRELLNDDAKLAEQNRRTMHQDNALTLAENRLKGLRERRDQLETVVSTLVDLIATIQKNDQFIDRSQQIEAALESDRARLRRQIDLAKNEIEDVRDQIARLKRAKGVK